MPIILPIIYKDDPKGLRDAEANLDKFGGTLKGIGVAAGVAFAAVSAGLVALGAASVKTASDFQETSAAVGEIFGPAAKSLEEFAKSAPATLGQTQGEFLSAVKTFGIFGNAAGLAADENAEFSKELAILATDLASFNNTSVDTAINAIGAGLRGESEPLRQFGVLLDDATLKARAMELGIYTGTGALSQQQRVLAAQAEILAQTSTQQGDFARTSDGMANGLKIMTAQLDNLKLVLGQALYPTIAELIPVVTEFINSLVASPAFEGFVQSLATVLEILANTIIEMLPPFMNLLDVILPPIMDLFNTLVPIILMLVDAFMPLIQGVLPPLVQLLNAVLPIFSDLMMKIIEPLIPIVIKLVESFAPMIEKILPPLVRLIEALIPVVFALIDAFLPLIDSLLPPLLDLFLTLNEPLLALLEKILPPLTEIIKGFGGVIKWLVDNMIKPAVEWITTLYDAFNKFLGLDGKSVTVRATGISYNNDGSPNRDGNPATPMALGGIVLPRPGGTLAQIGEAGKAEAVIPLDRLDSMIGSRAGGSGATYNINITAGMGADGASIGEQIVTAIRKYERTSGRVFAAA